MLKARILLAAIVAASFSTSSYAQTCLEKDGVSVETLISALSGELGDCQKTRGIEILLPEEKAEEKTVNFVAMDIQFEFDSARLTPDARQQLDTLAAALASEKLVGSNFAVEGYTDASGAADYNLRLSEQRAKSVQKYLSVTGGIDNTRLFVAGKGETAFADPADPESPVNRRVEIVNLGASN